VAPVDAGRALKALGVPEDVASAVAAALDADGDGRVSEQEVVTAFAQYFTVPE
ncbi:EF-hand domain-containing protein, partial [Streptomyces sp. SID10116]|nr:EF-hand domain-containing protein [Streptomyces sp. SID10116]